jgi:hypothetical protein
MSTALKSQATQSTGSVPIPELLLNGFRLVFSSKSFSARRMELPDNKHLKELRVQHSDWFTYWREGVLYAIPRKGSPRTTIGEPVTLVCNEHLQFIVSLIDVLLPNKFPGYEAFRSRPFAFAGKKDELVGASVEKLRTQSPLLKYFTIRPTFILEAKIIEPISDQTAVGLFLTINTKWEITADLAT